MNKKESLPSAYIPVPACLGTGRIISVFSALNNPLVCINGDKTIWAVFKRSLDDAIRDIEKHPQGKLFRRLIEYGPHNPDDSESFTSDGGKELE